MRSTTRRSGSLLGFAVGVAFLATSSVAFACTMYAGKTTVSDYVVNPTTGADTSVSQSVSEDGDPVTAAHWYCTGALPTRTPVDLTGPKFTVTVGTTTTCAATGNQALLGNTGYKVLWLDVTKSEPLKPMCQDQTNWPSTEVASFTTDASGSGGGANNATLPAFTAPALIDICVVHATEPTKQNSGPTVWLEVI